MLPPSDPLSVTLASPPTSTTAPLVPATSKLPAAAVPVQVSPTPQVTPPAVDTATVDAVAPLMIVAYCRSLVLVSVIWRRILAVAVPVAVAARSEEHTSELQSLMRISYAVFCLKKK